MCAGNLAEVIGDGIAEGISPLLGDHTLRRFGRVAEIDLLNECIRLLEFVFDYRGQRVEIRLGDMDRA